MAESQYVILQGLPTPQTYHDLRKLAGMTPPPMEAVPKSLANSFCCIVGYERKHMLDDTTPRPGQDAIAMGRLVGDGSLFLILVDVAVHPHHQRKGLGKRIMQKLVDYVDEHAPLAYVSLVAEEQAQKLYPLYGFKDVAPSIGMYRMIRERKIQQDMAKETDEDT
jgi:ribosomal protein S18 acetylase RimI-like enzyme